MLLVCKTRCFGFSHAQRCRLSHPHLVQALDFLQSHFQAAVVLSYHPGQSLDLAVKGQPFPERIARRLFHQLMSAISYLHNQGVLHRDVKAENILVSPDHQNMHLADFNTAKAVQDGGALTMTGTMEYSAPEVLAGNSPSHGQDVWGCGLCLHMMLSARLPQRLCHGSTCATISLRRARQSSPTACVWKRCPVPVPLRFLRWNGHQNHSTSKNQSWWKSRPAESLYSSLLGTDSPTALAGFLGASLL